MYKKLFVVILFCALAQSSMGSFGLLGGFHNIDPSDVPENEVDMMVKQLCATYKLGAENVKLKCAKEQLVNGLNYRLYFTAGDKTCEVKYYKSFRGEIDGVRTSCDIEGGLKSCLSHNKPPVGKSRKRRSLMMSSKPRSQQKLKFSKGQSFVKYLFDVFNRNFNRTYGTVELKQKKFEVFAENMELMHHLNRIERGTARYGITKFMDLTTDEFSKLYRPGFVDHFGEKPKLFDTKMLKSTKIPDSVDWREKGAVTPVKNQGSCGSCWAFSTTGNVEGQWFRKTGKLVSLSEQELVDCDAVDQGCNGGLPSNAYNVIKKLGGLEDEADYPYDGADEKCKLDQSKLKVYLNDSVALPTDEVELAKWVAEKGPISIGLNANLMQFYWGGISHPWKIFCRPGGIDHGVLIVGFGTEDDKPYWIIKNSWGPDWGEDGYYRLYRGDGSCGVNQMATSAIVD